MKLVCSTCLCTPPVDQKFSNSLLPSVDLMTDAALRSNRFPSSPLDGRLFARLGLLRTESILLATTHVPSRRHVLHHCPQVQSVGIVPYSRSTGLFAPYLRDILLMVSVKYDSWTNMIAAPPTMLFLTSWCRSLFVLLNTVK